MGKPAVNQAETAGISCDVGASTIGRESRSDGAKDSRRTRRRRLRGFAVRSGPVLPSGQVIHRDTDPTATGEAVCGR